MDDDMNQTYILKLINNELKLIPIKEILKNQLKKIRKKKYG